MKDLFPILQLAFYKRVVLLVVGVAISVVPELLTGAFNVALSAVHAFYLYTIGVSLACFSFFSIIFLHDVDNGVDKGSSKYDKYNDGNG